MAFLLITEAVELLAIVRVDLQRGLHFRCAGYLAGFPKDQETLHGVDKMKVLMKQDVAKIGKKGELLEVKEGYARNFLIPNGLAVEASGGALKQHDEAKKAQDLNRHYLYTFPAQS